MRELFENLFLPLMVITTIVVSYLLILAGVIATLMFVWRHL